MTQRPFNLPAFDLKADAFAPAMTDMWKSLSSLSVPPADLAKVQADYLKSVTDICNQSRERLQPDRNRSFCTGVLTHRRAMGWQIQHRSQGVAGVASRYSIHKSDLVLAQTKARMSTLTLEPENCKIQAERCPTCQRMQQLPETWHGGIHKRSKCGKGRHQMPASCATKRQSYAGQIYSLAKLLIYRHSRAGENLVQSGFPPARELRRCHKNKFALQSYGRWSTHTLTWGYQKRV